MYMYNNFTFSLQVLGDKGEAEFPDFESGRVSFKNEKESIKLKKLFHVKDRLHFCGSCEDDFKGKTGARQVWRIQMNGMIWNGPGLELDNMRLIAINFYTLYTSI